MRKKEKTFENRRSTLKHIVELEDKLFSLYLSVDTESNKM